MKVYQVGPTVSAGDYPNIRGGVCKPGNAKRVYTQFSRAADKLILLDLVRPYTYLSTNAGMSSAFCTCKALSSAISTVTIFKALIPERTPSNRKGTSQVCQQN
jgi:hypothetical protein